MYNNENEYSGTSFEYNNGFAPGNNGFAFAALILGVSALFSLFTVYLPLILGSLAILFALLSKGYGKKMAATAKIGFISAIHGKFCNSCNRIRLTATGDLKPCLCYQERILVKDALRSGDTKAAQKLLAQAIFQKPAAHCFETLSSITEDAEMSRIGG